MDDLPRLCGLESECPNLKLLFTRASALWKDVERSGEVEFASPPDCVDSRCDELLSLARIQVRDAAIQAPFTRPS